MPLFCGGSHGAFARFFPWDIGLPREERTSRRPTKSRTATSVRTQFRSFRGVLIDLFNPPVLLTTQVAPTAVARWPLGSRGVYIQAGHASLPSRDLDMLAA